MQVLVANQQTSLSIASPSVKAIVKEVLAFDQLSTDEVSICFVTTEEICRLHKEFFNDPSPTDCISFPVDALEDQGSGFHVLGEIFICPQTAFDYLKTETSSQDVYQEVTLYLVHGLLHLMGYDDREAGDRLEMRAAEKRHMENLLHKKLLLKGGRPVL